VAGVHFVDVLEATAGEAGSAFDEIPFARRSTGR